MNQFQVTPANIIQRLPTNSTQIDVYLRLSNGNGCCVHVDRHQSLNELFPPHILKLLGLTKPIKVTFKGKQLTDFELTLKEIGIAHESIIYLEESQNERERIKIEVGVYHKGETLYLSLKSDDKILDLKRQLYKLIRIPFRRQKIFFRGQQLINNETFNHYSISNSSLLCLITADPLNIITQNVKEDDSKWQTDSPKIRSIRGSMLDRDFEFNISPVKLGRSMMNNLKEDQLGYQVEIKENYQFEDQDLSGCKKYDFDFNFNELKLPSALQKTQSDYDQDESQINSSLKVDSDISFSERLMVL